MSDTVTQSQDQSQLTGTSNPPDGGQVTDTGITSSDENGSSTVPQTTAKDTPPPTQTPQVQPNNPSQPQSLPQQQPDGAQVDLSKAPKAGQPGGPTPVTPPPPAVQKASMFHDVAEALAGGPRYTYSVDAYGNMQRQAVPVSNGHIALAIAMEALSGAVTGLGQPGGPNAEGRAAAAGFQQGKQQVQQQDQEAKKQATDDFARRAQVTETNMRMLSSARALGKQDAETIDGYVGQYKDLATKMLSEYSGYVEGPVKYSDLSKYNATVDSAIPYMRTPRLDPTTGKQVEANGVPQWDIDYLIIKPTFKAAGLLSPDDLKTLGKWGQPWAENPNVPTTPMGAVLALNKKAQAAHLSVAQGTIDNYWKTVGAAHQTGNVGTSFDANKLNDLVDTHAKEAGVNPSLIRAVIEQESGGDPNAVSPTGATGLMQLTGTTAAQFGVKDRTNPEQNVKAGTQLFSQLMNQYKDPRLAYAAYYSGPGAIQNGQIVDTNAHTAADTTKQANHFMQIVDRGAQFPNAPKAVSPDDIKATVENHPTIEDWVKNNPTAASDMEKFMGALNGTDGKYSTAMQHLIATGQGDVAGKVASLLGGPDVIKVHDDYVQTQAETHKAEVQTQAIEDRAESAAARKKQTEDAVQDHKVAMITSLFNAKIPDNALQMSDADLVKSLQQSGVTLPVDALVDAKAVARYEAPLSIASNKRWFKDAKMDQGELLSIVKTLNPSYKTENFDSIRATTMPNSPVMKTVTSASQLANHLNMMQNIVNSQSAEKSPIPLLNRFMQTMGYETGGTQLTDLNAIANIVTSELGKTLAGGFAPDKEQIAQIIKTMNPANATQQMNRILDLYVGAMHGKVAPLDETYNQMSGAVDQHLTIPKSLSTLFQSRGYDTPWEKQGQQQAQKPNAFKPNDATQYPKISKDGKTGMDANGNKYNIATGQKV